jgi:antitoxin CptB
LTSTGATSRPSTEEINRLRWRARRGLLENDLMLERFFDQYAQTLSIDSLDALNLLLELGDNELLDIVLARQPIPRALDTLSVRAVIQMLQNP